MIYVNHYEKLKILLVKRLNNIVLYCSRHFWNNILFQLLWMVLNYLFYFWKRNRVLNLFYIIYPRPDPESPYPTQPADQMGKGKMIFPACWVGLANEKCLFQRVGQANEKCFFPRAAPANEKCLFQRTEPGWTGKIEMCFPTVGPGYKRRKTINIARPTNQRRSFQTGG